MGEGRYTGLAVAVVLAGVLASCSGSGDGGGDGDAGGKSESRGGSGAGVHGRPLSVGKVREMAEGPGDTCPVSYDVAAAAQAAGITERVTAGRVTGESPDDDAGEPQDPLHSFHAALVSCAYQLGKDKAHVYTIGAGKGTAVNVLLPQIQHDAGMGMDAVKEYADEANDASRGTPLLTPSGNVAAVRLPAAGKGDVALVVCIGEGGRKQTEATKAQVTDLAKELTAQARA